MKDKEAKAVAKTVRIAPRKTRLIINLIRSKKETIGYRRIRNCNGCSVGCDFI